MAITATLKGTQQVGDSGVLTLQEQINISSGTVTNSTSGKRQIAAATSVTLDFGNIGNAKYLWLKATDAATGNDKSVIPTISGATTYKPSSQLIVVNSDNPTATPITSVAVLTQAGFTTLLEWMIAG